MNNPASSAELVIQLSTLHARLTKRLEGPLGMHGISFSELLVLNALHQSPDQKMRRIDLAEAVGLTGSGITRMLKPMEKIGLIEKEANPRDARVSLVKLSKTGKRLHAEAWASFEHSAATLLSSLTDRQVASFAELAARAQ